MTFQEAIEVLESGMEVVSPDGKLIKLKMRVGNLMFVDTKDDFPWFPSYKDVISNNWGCPYCGSGGNFRDRPARGY